MQKTAALRTIDCASSVRWNSYWKFWMKSYLFKFNHMRSVRKTELSISFHCFCWIKEFQTLFQSGAATRLGGRVFRANYGLENTWRSLLRAVVRLYGRCIRLLYSKVKLSFLRVSLVWAFVSFVTEFVRSQRPWVRQMSAKSCFLRRFI